MIEFLIFLMSTIGATAIITQSYLFKPFRVKLSKINAHLGKFIGCPQCVGFYVGVIIQFIIVLHSRMEFIFYLSDIFYILYGFIGSFICYTTYILLKPLTDKYD